MTTDAIVPESADSYRAVSGDKASVGRTPGEALDALSAQLTDEEGGTLLVIQNRRPDAFFTAEQQGRLADLMARWRAARDAGHELEPSEQAELDGLVQAALHAAGQRAVYKRSAQR